MKKQDIASGSKRRSGSVPSMSRSTGYASNGSSRNSRVEDGIRHLRASIRAGKTFRQMQLEWRLHHS